LEVVMVPVVVVVAGVVEVGVWVAVVEVRVGWTGSAQPMVRTRRKRALTY
jgi:hypothetical protein